MAPKLSCAIGVPNVGTFGDPSVLVELAVAAEEHGWDGFFVWTTSSTGIRSGRSRTRWW